MKVSEISPTKQKALLACFVGLHVPLAVLAVYGMATGLPSMLPVLVVTLIATLVGVAGTLYALLRILNMDDTPVTFEIDQSARDFMSNA